MCTGRTAKDCDSLNIITLKVVPQGCPRCPDSDDLSECHNLYYLKTLIFAKSCKKFSTEEVNFDSKKLSVETLQDHLNVFEWGPITGSNTLSDPYMPETSAFLPQGVTALVGP